MVLPRSGSQLHREFLRAAYLAHFYFFFINDLPGVLPEGTQSALYADDTKVFSSISSIAVTEKRYSARFK